MFLNGSQKCKFFINIFIFSYFCITSYILFIVNIENNYLKMSKRMR